MLLNQRVVFHRNNCAEVSSGMELSPIEGCLPVFYRVHIDVEERSPKRCDVRGRAVHKIAVHEDDGAGRAYTGFNASPALDELHETALGKSHQYVACGVSNRFKVIDDAIAMRSGDK